MSKYAEVAKLFDLELEEEFCLDYYTDRKFKFTELGLFVAYEGENCSYCDNSYLGGIVSGTFKVIKIQKPYRPKFGEPYYYVDISMLANPVRESIWSASSIDNYRLELGLIRKTEDEINQRANEIIALLTNKEE